MEIKNLTHTITVKDIYGTDSPKAPEGYEFTGEFRGSRVGDTILAVPHYNLNEPKAANGYEDKNNFRYPVLILRPAKQYSDTEMLDFLIESAQSYDLYEALEDGGELEIAASRENLMKFMRSKGV